MLSIVILASLESDRPLSLPLHKTSAILPDNFYDTLGVPKDAPEKEIRAAYRRLARKFHPDVNPGNKEGAERFKKINEAYEVLSDVKTRKDFDDYGLNWKHAEELRKAGARPGEANFSDAWPGPGGRRSGYDPRTGTRFEYFSSGAPGGADMSDLFDVFGGGAGSRGNGGRAQQSAQELEVEVSLDEAYRGTTRLLHVERGRGRQSRLEVKVPAGIGDGGRVRIRPDNSPEIDLIVKVQPDPRFRREGADLYAEVPVPLHDLALGGEADVPTMTGRVVLKIPAGTQNGRIFRLAGKGMPRLGTSHGHGDMLVTVRALLPEPLTDEERGLFERLRDIRKDRVAPASGGDSR